MQEIIVESKNCKQCNIIFDILENDLSFYEKVSPVFNGKKYFIPSPTLCPECRQKRRLAFRNERSLYKGTCDSTGRDIISIYSPEKHYKVYNQESRWGDTWDALDYGIDFDFNRGFFDQLGELVVKIPKQNIIGSNNTNSSYCNLAADNKNCYLISESSNNEDCYYGYWLQKCNYCVDSGFMHECTKCYESESCHNCYNSSFLFNCKDSRDSYYLEDCIGCKNCIGCVNLSNKEYYIFNKKYGVDEYKKEKERLFNSSDIREEFLEFKKNYPKKYSRILNSENCSGDQIEDSKDCYKCFHAHDAESCRHAEHVWRNAKDCMDVSTAGRDAEKIYESINCGISDYNINFSVQCWSNSHDLNYCMNIHNSNHCFACSGLKNKEYCIFNKQYSKEEYNEFVPKIIEKMKNDGDWGEFFPAQMSPFGYNESVVSEVFPLLKEQAINKGFNWSNYEAPVPKVKKTIPGHKLPRRIKDIPDDILNWAIECEVTKKPFRIIKEELEFYRNHNLPIPRRHPDQRNLDRMILRNSRKIFSRKCDKCFKEIETTYSPVREELVYCEECYNNEIY